MDVLIIIMTTTIIGIHIRIHIVIGIVRIITIIHIIIVHIIMIIDRIITDLVIINLVRQ